MRRFRAARPHHGHCPQPAGRHPSAPAQSPRPGLLAARGPWRLQLLPGRPGPSCVTMNHTQTTRRWLHTSSPRKRPESRNVAQSEEATHGGQASPEPTERGPSVACRCTDVLYFPVVSSIDFPPYSLYLVFEIPRTVWAVLRQLRLATRCFLYIHAPTNMSKLYSSN